MTAYRLGVDIGGTYVNALDATCGPCIDAGNRRRFSMLRRIAMVDIPE